MFDKRLFISNIYQLAKERSVKIGDLEKKAGVSVGYLSRINKEDSNTVPTIDFVASVAAALGVSVDAIIKNDYSTPTPTESYILSFVDRLLTRTNADELDWKKETVSDLHTIGYDEHGEPNHPLYITSCGNNEPEAVYNSRFHSEFDIIDDSFKLSLPGVSRTIVYLMCVDDPEMQDTPFASPSYELYIVKNWTVQPLCCSLPVGSLFDSCLTKLYEAVKESSNHPKLASDIVTAIDAFMNNSSLVEETSDEELPF